MSAPSPALPITSTTTASSTTCDSAYNTVTYSIQDPILKSYESSGMMPSQLSSVVRSLMQQTTATGKPTIDTITMCVNKKCPDGNFAINVGKMMYPNFNSYACLNLPDTTTSANGETTSTCKAGMSSASLGSPPGMCISTPQVYFPKFQ